MPGTSKKPYRPDDDSYWVSSWASTLFAGDVFEAVPFVEPPTEVYTADSDDDAAQHFVGEVGFAYGLLITPTCDMYEAIKPEPRLAHPFRVLVPILDFAEVLANTTTLEESENLLRKRDSLHAYMYLPPLPNHFDESVACLYRPTIVSDDFLSSRARRVVQMHPEARRHLKVKLAAYWGRVAIDAEVLPLEERDEDDARSEESPPSPYDLVQ